MRAPAMVVQPQPVAMEGGMPLTLNERERAFEAKFAYDETFRFLVSARRDKLLAHWTAVTLRLSEQAETKLFDALLAIPNKADHDQMVANHLALTFARRGHGRQEDQIIAAMSMYAEQARQQLIAGPLDDLTQR
jgi:hypothetical protein